MDGGILIYANAGRKCLEEMLLKRPEHGCVQQHASAHFVICRCVLDISGKMLKR